MIADGAHASARLRAEYLYEEIGGDLCTCQRPDVPSWCESCQRRIDRILAYGQAVERETREPLTELVERWREAESTGRKGTALLTEDERETYERCANELAAAIRGEGA